MLKKLKKFTMEYDIEVQNKNDEMIVIPVVATFDAGVSKTVDIVLPEGDGDFKFDQWLLDRFARSPAWDAISGVEACGLFVIDEAQMGKAKAWLEEHNKTCKFANPKKTGAIGGRLSYRFTDTTMGRCTSIECACKESESLTDFNDW
jgi:hypothetical protein